MDVLRPPSFSQLATVLQAARDRGKPYQVVHFDGHGAWLDDATLAAGRVESLGRDRFSVLSRTAQAGMGTWCSKTLPPGRTSSWWMAWRWGSCWPTPGCRCWC